MKFNSKFIAVLFLLINAISISKSVGQVGTEFLPIEENKFWGFVNKEGKVVIEPKFISVDIFSEVLAGVQLNEIVKLTELKRKDFLLSKMRL